MFDRLDLGQNNVIVLHRDKLSTFDALDQHFDGIVGQAQHL